MNQAVPDPEPVASRAPDPAPPTTGVAEIDAALAAVRLDGELDEHHAELSAAVEALQRALRTQ